MSEYNWILQLEDPDDPHKHTARAVQLEEHRWSVQYFRDGVLASDGGISTPPPHMPPTATLLATLKQMRQEADYWAKRESGVSRG